MGNGLSVDSLLVFYELIWLVLVFTSLEILNIFSFQDVLKTLGLNYIRFKRISKFKYPVFPIAPVIPTHRPEKSLDALEDLSSETVQEWLREQNSCTDAYMTGLENLKDKLFVKLRESSEYDEILAPFKRGDLYFQVRKYPQEEFFLHVTKDITKEGFALLHFSERDGYGVGVDEFWIGNDGKRFAVVEHDKELNNNKIRIKNISSKGLEEEDSDILDIHDKNPVVCWIGNSNGIFYSNLGPPVDNNSSTADVRLRHIYYHAIGALQENDPIIYTVSSTSAKLTLVISSDRKYLIVHDGISKESDFELHESIEDLSSGNIVDLIDIQNFRGRPMEVWMGSCYRLISSAEFRYEYIVNTRNNMLFRTNYQAPNFRVVKVSLGFMSPSSSSSTSSTRRKSSDEIDLFCGFGGIGGMALDDSSRRTSRSLKQTSTDLEGFEAIAVIVDSKSPIDVSGEVLSSLMDWIPNHPNGLILRKAQAAYHTVLVLKYIRDAAHTLVLYDMLEPQRPIQLPHPPYGTIQGPNCEPDSTDIFFKYSGFADPGSVYIASIVVNEMGRFVGELTFDQQRAPSVPAIDLYDFDTRQEFLETLDGTVVPLFIFGPRDTRDSPREKKPRPCILHAYGGFGVPVLPTFSLPILTFVRHFHGYFCLANVRGGGEYGPDWHSAGCGINKQKSTQDLLEVAQFLIEGEFTTQQQLGLMGGCNGGLVLAAGIVRQPWLFGAAIIESGVFDLLRYNQLDRVGDGPFGRGLHTADAVTDMADPDTADAQDRPEEQQSTNLWRREYGPFGDSDAELQRLVKSSPLHSVKNVELKYPAMLLTAEIPSEDADGNYDCQVPAPQHAMKFAARLQTSIGSLSIQKKPLLLRVNGLADKKRSEPAEENATATPSTEMRSLLARNPSLQNLRRSEQFTEADLDELVHSEEVTELRRQAEFLAFLAANLEAEWEE